MHKCQGEPNWSTSTLHNLALMKLKKTPMCVVEPPFNKAHCPFLIDLEQEASNDLRTWRSCTWKEDHWRKVGNLD